jgi:hypothetical protein
MTAAELIRQLQKFPSDAGVFIYDVGTRVADEIVSVNWDADLDVMLSITPATREAQP